MAEDGAAAAETKTDELDDSEPKETEPLNKFYEMVTGDDKAKKEWVAKAHTSECATKIDEILKDTDSDKVQALKDEMFERIYETMSEEVIPENMKMAIVVKNLKFRWITSCFLTVFTLGFFLLVRPKDDDAVMVLTGQNRVILLKRARHDFFGSTGSALMFTILRYLLILFFVLMLPSLLWGVLANGSSQTQQMSLALMNMEIAVDKQVAKVLREKAFIVVICAILFVLYLVFFLWTKIPYDYGTRFRRSHAGTALTCAQLAFHGSKTRRQGMLRLHFGKYPFQDMLDHGMPISSGQVVGPVAADLDANGKYGNHDKGRAFFTMVAMLLTVTTLIDAGFTWYERSIAALSVVSSSTFCEEATKKGPSFCTANKCITWAANVKADHAFCSHVKWYLQPGVADGHGDDGGGDGFGDGGGDGFGDGGDGFFGARRLLEGLEGLEGGAGDGGAAGGSSGGSDFGNPLEAEALCRTYRPEGPPCCGGCRKGKFLHYLSNTFSIVKESAAILTDLCAICLSFAAAQHVISTTRVSDHVEVPFTKSPSATQPISNFNMTCPLALYFFHLVFTVAFPEREKKAPMLRRQQRDDDLAGNQHGVKNYDIEEECETWDEFFKSHSLAAEGSTHYTPKLKVPKRALGILGGEEIYGAWLESPRLTIVGLLPVIITSSVIFLIFAFWPSNWKAVILPGLSNSPLAKVFTAFVLGLVALCLGSLFYYIFIIRSVQHAVVVTSERVFYLRYRSQCLLFCWWGSGIRVDVFRHDHDIFYGHMETMAPSLMQKFLRFEWLPGDTYAQCIWGVLYFKRRFGNAVDVFHCVSQLALVPDYMQLEDFEKAGVDGEVCRNSLKATLEQKHDVVWSLKRQPDDVAREDPLLYMIDKEEPLFTWSTKEVGAVSSPYHINNDLVVSSGRVFLWQRAIYKPFDCKTCCCFGACWCTCFKKVFQANRLQTSMSFIALPMLLSFSTDLDVEPPLWYDPNATPVKVPCCEKFCRALTLCSTCDCRGARRVLGDPDMKLLKPRRRGPRTQLWMMWKARFGPIISFAIKPYAAPECDNKDLEALGVMDNNHSEMMKALDKIMNVAQAKHV